MSAWPASVWSAPALCELGARARGEIGAAGALRVLSAGQHAFRVGDVADALFAVAAGAITVRASRRGEVDARVVREARAGETFGEEAMVTSSALRRSDAIAARGATIASIPAGLLRRLLERDASRTVDRVTRTLERTLARERLSTSSLARTCTEADLDLLLDAITHVHVARGEPIFREGDPGARAFVIAEGMIQIQTEGDRTRVRAYLAAGDTFGDEHVTRGEPRSYAAIASGPAWLLAIPADAVHELLARAPGAFDDARRVREERRGASAQIARDARTTRHVLRDLYRFDAARSLLVIDQESCVQCGHCSWSCASAHADGTSRLVRRGDVLVARVDGEAGARPILVASSCQHCENPACMPVCPTGAIGRDPRGDVFLRESLCTGCGACAKACPWEAIRMAPRPDQAGSVAVKCDLCRGSDGGPACVEACPTQAIARVDPHEALPEVRAARGEEARVATPIARAIPAWPFVAIGAAAALVAWRASSAVAIAPMVSGAIAGASIAALGAYGVWKRVVRRAGRLGYVVHLALGPIAIAAVARHVAWRAPPNAAGALVAAALVALASGAAGALAYAWIPSRLARIERRGALPEDLPARIAETDARAFVELTGRSDRLKAVFVHVLRPYASAPLGALALIIRGTDLRAEETRLRARITRLLAGRSAGLDGVDALVRTAVESRALAAQRVLQRALRAWLPLHVIAAAVALALLAVHVAVVLAFR